MMKKCNICDKETEQIGFIKWGNSFSCRWGFDYICDKCLDKILDFMNKERKKKGLS